MGKKKPAGENLVQFIAHSCFYIKGEIFKAVVWVWRDTPLTLALGRWGQADLCELLAREGDPVRLSQKGNKQASKQATFGLHNGTTHQALRP